VDPWNLRQCEWGQKLGKIECEFSLYDKRRWKWDDVYLLWGLPNIYSPSLCPPPLPLYLLTTAVVPSRCTGSSVFEMHLVMEIEGTQRCTPRSWPSEFGDAIGGHARANLQPVIERVWRYTRRPGLSEFGDALGGHDAAILQAVIEQVWRYTWRPWLSEFRDALGGHDQANLQAIIEASLESHLEAAIERVWRCTCRLWWSEIGGVLGGGRFGGRRDGSWDSIYWLTCNCGNVESWVQHLPRDEKLAGSGRLSILGWYCTWCML